MYTHFHALKNYVVSDFFSHSNEARAASLFLEKETPFLADKGKEAKELTQGYMRDKAHVALTG